MSDKRSELNLHVAKSLIQFIVVLFFGALVADFYKRVERQRTENDRLAHFREDIRKRLGEAYQQAKKCRSKLRASGITTQHCDSMAAMEQLGIDAYRCQCELLNEVQLDLEKLWHEVDCFRCAFTHDKDIVNRIKIMSGFIRKVVDEYEANWCNLSSVCKEERTIPKLKMLAHLVGKSTEGWFREKFCDRYSEAIDFIRRDELRP